MPLEWWEWVAAALVGVVGTARLVRLGAEDEWPPAAALRNWYIRRTEGSGWQELAICPFCQAPWWAALTGAWAWASGFHWSWWAFYGWLAASYAAAMVVARDIPDGE